VRIEYPWQKEERAAKAAAAGGDGAAAVVSSTPPPPREEPASITQRILIEERLDSADEPRPRTAPTDLPKPKDVAKP